MNKPESKPTQSLEEILASIRKALAEEEVQGGAESPAQAEPAPVAKEQSMPAKADGLSGQLAVALNGSGPHDAATDDDLDDLLAPAPSKKPGAASTESAPVDSASEEKKDPLWFLVRKPAQDDVSASDDKAKAPAVGNSVAPPPQEEIKLTRPETLRTSLPPLFGAEERLEVKAEPVSFVQPSVPQPAKVQPAVAKPAEPPEAAAPEKVKEPEKAKEEKRETKAPPPERMPLSDKIASLQSARPELSTPLPTPPPPGEMRASASVAPAAEAMASALATPQRSTPKGSPAASAQARELERMIGQLLEPVIRNWLDANLPRLVEKVVREEVTRATASKPDAAKD